MTNTEKSFIILKMVIIIGLVLGAGYGCERARTVNTYYTVGTIIGYSLDADAHTYVDYEFYVYDQKCKGSAFYSYKKPTSKSHLEKRYYVTFNPTLPSFFNKLYLDKPVDDSIKIVPEGGWMKNLDSLFLKKVKHH